MQIMALNNTVYNWYVFSWYLVNRDISNLVRLIDGVREEQEVSTVKGWLHRSAQNDDDRALAVSEKAETFPHHQTACDDCSKIQGLQEDLPKSHPAKRFELLVEHMVESSCRTPLCTRPSPVISYMSVLKESISRSGSVFAGSSSPSRLNGAKRPMANKPQAQQLERPLRTRFTARGQTLVAISQRPEATNALQLQTGMNPESDPHRLGSSTLYPLISTYQRGEAAARRKGPTVVKRSFVTSVKEKAQDSGALSAEPQTSTPALERYDYSTYSPTPLRMYIRSRSEADTALDTTIGPLGFDMEWNVSWRKQTQRLGAVIQLATPRKIFILQVCAMKGFPRKLKEILEDPTIVKTGVNIRGDATKLFKDYQVKAQNLVELSWLSNRADPSSGAKTARRLVALKTLIRKYLQRDLEKDAEGPRMSNWERLLNEEQQRYASNDVHSSIILYHHLMDLAAQHKLTLKPSDFTLNVGIDGTIAKDARVDSPNSTEEGPMPAEEESSSVSKAITLETSDTPTVSETLDSDEEVERIFTRFQRVCISNPKNPAQNSVEPLVDETVPMSRTMAYAAGLKK